VFLSALENLISKSINLQIRMRLCLDVDIGSPGIELDQIPNQASIDIELQYQSCCLDTDGIIRWHCTSQKNPTHVWMCMSWNGELAAPHVT
jgi:hypothetical protein